MTREELYKYIERIDDPKKDFGKILTNLHSTHYFLMDMYKKILKPYDLTLTQSSVLGIIVHHSPDAIALEDIKAMILEPNSDVSRTVVRLAAKGFVEKVINKTNRRKVSIRALPKGIKMAKKLILDPEFTNLTAGISLAEAKAFVKFLKRLRKAHVKSAKTP